MLRRVLALLLLAVSNCAAQTTPPMMDGFYTPPIADGMRPTPPPFTGTPPRTTAAPVPVATIEVCPSDADPKYAVDCERLGAEPVCTPEGKQYKNKGCAACNGEKDYTAGECATVIDTCVAGTSATYRAYCKNQAARTVCSRLTNRMYKNNYCALCNNERSYTNGECKPLPPHISTCEGKKPCSQGFVDTCKSRGWNPVCVNGKTYRNTYCAQCNDIPTQQIGSGACITEEVESKFIANCSAADQPRCKSQPEDPVCGWDGRTYRNRFCANCNNIYQMASGVCNAKPPSVCEAANCGDNAGCYEDYSDCNFEKNSCGWSADTNGWKLVKSGDVSKTPNPGFDYNYRNDPDDKKSGHYYLASGNRAYTYLTTIKFPTKDVTSGLGCRMIFHVAAGKGARLALQMAEAPTASSPYARYRIVWDASQLNRSATPEKGPWFRQQVAASDVAQFGDYALARFMASTSSGYAAVDEIRVVCGANHEEGVCACKQGYHEEAAPGEDFRCVIDDGETPAEPQDVVSTCRQGAGCSEQAACELGPEAPVCGGGATLYRNIDCARCNFESAVYGGSCKVAAKDDDVVSTCQASGANQNDVNNCKNMGKNIVCVGGQNYKNIFCSRCNGNPSTDAAFYGYCSGVVSAVRQEVITKCPASFRGSTSSCTTGRSFVVCGKDGKQYKNAQCAACNGISYSAYQSGFCEQVERQPEPGRNVVDTCSAKSTSATYDRLCKTAVPATVCGNEINYRNRYCAYCNGLVGNAVTNSPCRAREFPVVENCTDPDDNFKCRFFTPDPVCGDNGNTYTNRECALCNGLAPRQFRRGSCFNVENVWNPCKNVTCGKHASCAKMVADCDFETDTCGWTNGDGDDFQWTRHAGPTDSKATGPSVDHTRGDAKGHFMYIEASGQAEGEDAHFVSPVFNATANGFNCRLSLWYHMWGAGVEDLAIDLKEVQFDNTWSPLLVKEPARNPGLERHDQWNHVDLSLSHLAYRGLIQLRIRGRRGSGPAGDVAIDDVELICGQETEGECLCDEGYILDAAGACVVDPDEVVTTTAPPATTEAPDGTVATCPADAGFAGALACSTLGDRPVCIDGNRYKNSGCAICNGADLVGSLTGSCAEEGVVAACPDTANQVTALACTSPFFAEAKVCDEAAGTTYKNAACAACNGASATVDGECGVPAPAPCDSVKCGRNQECARTVADCDFESADNPLCGWTNGDGGDQFDWTRQSNGTPTAGTGPSADHTTGTSAGHYLYIEATGQEAGHEAHLYSPVFRPADLGSDCRLEFYYHMYGSSVDELGIELRHVDDGSNSTRVWTVRPPPNSAERVHDTWRNHAHVGLGDFTGEVQVKIVGRRGKGIKGDVAIDDLRVVCGTQTVGSCRCKEGFTLSESGRCVPDVMTVLRETEATRHVAEFFEAAGFSDTLAGYDQVTLFLPDADAFGAVDNATAAFLLEGSGRDQLRSVLSYHLSPGRIRAEDLVNGQRLTTELNNATIAVRRSGDKVTLNADVSVVRADIEASNGMVHLIDGFLVELGDDLADFCGAAGCSDQQYCRATRVYDYRRPAECQVKCGTRADYVCALTSGGHRSVFSRCYAECTGLQVVYEGPCWVGQCASYPTCGRRPNQATCDRNAYCSNANTAMCTCRRPWFNPIDAEGATVSGTRDNPCLDEKPSVTTTPAPACRSNMEYSEKTPACMATCQARAPDCPAVYIKGCACPADAPYWSDKAGRCLKAETCDKVDPLVPTTTATTTTTDVTVTPKVTTTPTTTTTTTAVDRTAKLKMYFSNDYNAIAEVAIFARDLQAALEKALKTNSKRFVSIDVSAGSIIVDIVVVNTKWKRSVLQLVSDGFTFQSAGVKYTALAGGPTTTASTTATTTVAPNTTTTVPATSTSTTGSSEPTTTGRFTLGFFFPDTFDTISGQEAAFREAIREKLAVFGVLTREIASLGIARHPGGIRVDLTVTSNSTAGFVLSSIDDTGMVVKFGGVNYVAQVDAPAAPTATSTGSAADTTTTTSGGGTAKTTTAPSDTTTRGPTTTTTRGVTSPGAAKGSTTTTAGSPGASEAGPSTTTVAVIAVCVTVVLLGAIAGAVVVQRRKNDVRYVGTSSFDNPDYKTEQLAFENPMYGSPNEQRSSTRPYEEPMLGPSEDSGYMDVMGTDA